MKILVAGDLVITNRNNTPWIDNKVLNLFKSSDFNIVNLESPITGSASKIRKTGPYLKADKESIIQVCKVLNVDIVTLANNHILDYDEQGVSDTLAFCRENNIQTVGAGMNLKEASRIRYINTIEGCLAIVNFAENEWACATKTTAGANPMDLIDNYRQIQDARKNADFVLIIVHGGNEYNPYPSPRMVKQYRFYAENGADAVIGHHTHCISGYEKHCGVPIFYSLGNFLFTMGKGKPDSWYSGLVVQLEIKHGEDIQLEVIPVSQDKDSNTLSLMQGEAKSDLFELIDEINTEISDPQLLEEKWRAFIGKVQGSFIKTISPLGGIKSRYLKAILYRSGLYKLLLHNRYLKEHLNRIRCEAHLDVSKAVLEKLVRKTKRI